MTSKIPNSHQLRIAEDIMSEDRAILRALATTAPSDQMMVARHVMKKRRSALKKLAE